MDGFDGLWYECNSLDSRTSEDQCECEEECSRFLIPLNRLSNVAKRKLASAEFITTSGNNTNDWEWSLLKEKHINYLLGGLGRLSNGFVSLDAS